MRRDVFFLGLVIALSALFLGSVISLVAASRGDTSPRVDFIGAWLFVGGVTVLAGTVLLVPQRHVRVFYVIQIVLISLAGGAVYQLLVALADGQHVLPSVLLILFISMGILLVRVRWERAYGGERASRERA